MPLDDPDVVFVVTNSGIRHRNASGAYGERVQQCKDAVAAVSLVFESFLRSRVVRGLRADIFFAACLACGLPAWLPASGSCLIGCCSLMVIFKCDLGTCSNGYRWFDLHRSKWTSFATTMRTGVFQATKRDDKHLTNEIYSGLPFFAACGAYSTRFRFKRDTRP